MRGGMLVLLLFFSFAAFANKGGISTNSQPQLQQSIPISQEDLEELRKITDKNSGFIPKNYIREVKKVRTGSGGGGVACFKNDDEAMQVIDINTRQIKKNADLRKIKWIVSYDYLTFNNAHLYFRKDLILPNLNEDPMNYLSRILNIRVAPLNPSFAQNLQDVLFNKIHPSSWIDRPSLPLLNDTAVGSKGVSKNLIITMENCPAAWYIQLAVRYQSIENDFSLVETDKKILNHMRQTLSASDPRQASLNEALLILHEALYYLSMKNKKISSEHVIKFSGDLLSTGLDRKMLADRLKDLGF